MNVAGSRHRSRIKHVRCKKGAFLRQTERFAVAVQPYSSPAPMRTSLSPCLYEAWLPNGSSSSSFFKQVRSFTKYSLYCAARGSPRGQRRRWPVWPQRYLDRRFNSPVSSICLQTGKRPSGHLFLRLIDCLRANQPRAASAMPGSPQLHESVALPSRLQTSSSVRDGEDGDNPALLLHRVTGLGSGRALGAALSC